MIFVYEFCDENAQQAVEKIPVFYIIYSVKCVCEYWRYQ